MPLNKETKPFGGYFYPSARESVSVFQVSLFTSEPPRSDDNVIVRKIFSAQSIFYCIYLVGIFFYKKEIAVLLRGWA